MLTVERSSTAKGCASILQLGDGSGKKKRSEDVIVTNPWQGQGFIRADYYDPNYYQAISFYPINNIWILGNS